MLPLATPSRIAKALHVTGQYSKGDRTGQIPPILHQMYLSGETAFRAKVADPSSTLSAFPRESCAQHHQHWEVLFWDMAAVKRLLQTSYPWFMETFQSYAAEVNKADASRPFIMHKFGGVYLDIDTECFCSLDESLRNHNILFQGAGLEAVNNGAMASIPGHALWLEAAQILQERKTIMNFGPVFQTGPKVMVDTIDRVAGVNLENIKSGHNGAVVQLPDGNSIKIFQIGTWFFACAWNDTTCRSQYEQPTTDSIERPQALIGYHWYAKTW